MRDSKGRFINGHIPWCKGKSIQLNTGRTHFKKGVLPWITGKTWTEEMRKKLSGKNSSNWKGKKVGYFGVHSWIRKKRGCPKKCESCGTLEAKKYEWANKDHKYRRNLSDWFRLCTRCHMAYDKKHRRGPLVR